MEFLGRVLDVLVKRKTEATLICIQGKVHVERDPPCWSIYPCDCQNLEHLVVTGGLAEAVAASMEDATIRTYEEDGGRRIFYRENGQRKPFPDKFR